MQSAEEFAKLIYRTLDIEGHANPDAIPEYWTGVNQAAVMIAARDAEWQARVDRLEAALKHIVEVEAKAHATGKYSLAVEWCADKARTALAESEAAHG